MMSMLRSVQAAAAEEAAASVDWSDPPVHSLTRLADSSQLLPLSQFRALELRLHSLKNLRTGASISISNAAQCFAQFISLAAGSGNAAAASQLQPSKDGVLTFWADATLASDLSAKADGRPIDLSNALVRVTTEGATLVARTVDLLKSAAENKPATTSYSGHPNLLAAAGAQYNPAAVAAMGAKNAANKAKDNDEEWDD